MVGYRDELFAASLALGGAAAVALVLDVALLFLPADARNRAVGLERERRRLDVSLDASTDGLRLAVRARF